MNNKNQRETIETKWQEKLAQLQTFKQEHGHPHVPQAFADNPALGMWCGKQRQDYKKGKLAADKIGLLEGLGFVWDPMEKQWQDKFAELQTFKAEHAHSNPPKRNTANPALGEWCITTRRAYKKGTLAEEKIALLEGLGFVWDPLETQWQEKFEELQAFKEEHGHPNVPALYAANTALGSWCRRQRKDYKKAKLAADKIGLLEGVGFVWDALETQWQEKFVELKAFKAEHEHPNVPAHYAANPALGSWCLNQRQDYKKGQLAADKIALFEDLGFAWDLFGSSRLQIYISKQIADKIKQLASLKGVSASKFASRIVENSIEKDTRSHGFENEVITKLNSIFDALNEKNLDKSQ
jgi:hypothetical protein